MYAGALELTEAVRYFTKCEFATADTPIQRVSDFVEEQRWNCYQGIRALPQGKHGFGFIGVLFVDNPLEGETGIDYD